jgi:t-SNARE complex subunit (syntaxin)
MEQDLETAPLMFTEDRVSERVSALNRINMQVHQVNRLFMDLASLAVSQGEQIESLETFAETTSSNHKAATLELRVTTDRKKQVKDLICIVTVLISLVLCAYTYRAFSPRQK